MFSIISEKKLLNKVCSPYPLCLIKKNSANFGPKNFGLKLEKSAKIFWSKIGQKKNLLCKVGMRNNVKIASVNQKIRKKACQSTNGNIYFFHALQIPYYENAEKLCVTHFMCLKMKRSNELGWKQDTLSRRIKSCLKMFSTPFLTNLMYCVSFPATIK